MAIVEIGFFDTGSTTGINYYPTTGSYNEPTRLTLVDQAGSATQVQISSSGGGSISTGTGVAAGINLPQFSDEVEGSYFYCDSDALEVYTFWNMPAGTHTLEIFASRGATGGRVGVYNFGTDSGTLDAANNTTNTLTLTYTATEGENVTFSFSRNTGNSFGYLNCALLTLASGPAVTAHTDPIVDDVQNSVTTSNLTGTPSGTLAGKSVTLSGSFPNLTYTYNWKDATSNTTAPRIGDTIQFAVTGNEGTATYDAASQAATGWATVELAGTLDKSTDSLLANIDSALGVTTAVTDIILYESRDNTSITATGVLTTDATDNLQMHLFQGGSLTTVANQYPFEVNGGSGSVNPSIPQTKYRRFPWQPWNPL